MPLVREFLDPVPCVLRGGFPALNLPAPHLVRTRRERRQLLAVRVGRQAKHRSVAQVLDPRLAIDVVHRVALDVRRQCDDHVAVVLERGVHEFLQF